jgi:hypothetical protein
MSASESPSKATQIERIFPFRERAPSRSFRASRELRRGLRIHLLLRTRPFRRDHKNQARTQLRVCMDT